jgi:hypothetical protein
LLSHQKSPEYPITIHRREVSTNALDSATASFGRLTALAIALEGCNGYLYLFDFITGSKSPAPDTAKQPAAALRTALLALNRDTAPWQVRDGAAENVDFVAEWRIVDARWVEIFAKTSLTKVFKILMKLDEAKGEVRSVDQEWSVAWRAGVPDLSLSAEAFRGQKVENELRHRHRLPREHLARRHLRLPLLHRRNQNAAPGHGSEERLALAGRGVQEAVVSEN